jgi:hypothetical protein
VAIEVAREWINKNAIEKVTKTLKNAVTALRKEASANALSAA